MQNKNHDQIIHSTLFLSWSSLLYLFAVNNRIITLTLVHIICFMPYTLYNSLRKTKIQKKITEFVITKILPLLTYIDNNNNNNDSNS